VREVGQNQLRKGIKVTFSCNGEFIGDFVKEVFFGLFLWFFLKNRLMVVFGVKS